MNEKLNEQKPVAEGLPELCFTTLPGTDKLICIKRGELGYYLLSWNTDDRQRNEELADYNNERLGITSNQKKAMEVGSMYGWDVPGADPANYENGEFVPSEQDGMIMGSM